MAALVAAVALAACDGDEVAGPAASAPAVATTATAAPASTAAPTATSEPTAVLTPTSTPGPAVLDPAEVFEAFIEAINDGDATRALALFAPEATWERGRQCPPGQCIGLERLRQEIERDVASQHRLDVVSLETSGPTVAATVELRTRQTRAAGVERIIQRFELSVADGKIMAFKAENDISDAVTAQFMSQRPGQP